MKRLLLGLIIGLTFASCQKENSVEPVKLDVINRQSLVAPQQQLPSNLYADLQLWLPFNGNTNDGSANHRNGVNNGATLVPDRFGHPNSAYQFDGFSSFIQCPAITELDSSKNFTVSAWVSIYGLYSLYTDRIYGYHQFIVSRGDITQWGSFDMNVVGEGGTYGTIVNGIYTNPNASIYTNLPSVSQNVWHHEAITYNGSTLKLYLDGALVGTVPYNLALGTNHSPIYIGRSSNNTTLQYFLDGAIDDIGVWNRTLSYNEIQELYKSK